MGARQLLYIDPSIAANTGTGTIGDPFGDTQFALNQQGTDYTRDATNGDQFNVLDGTDEILTDILSLVTYGTPTAAAPLVFRGYTAVANDGGQGGVDGNNGNFSVITSSHTHFIDMDCHNTGTADLFGIVASLQQCELHNTTAQIATAGSPQSFLQNHIYDISGTNVIQSVRHVYWNYFDNTQTKKSSILVDTGTSNVEVVGNYFTSGPDATICVNAADDHVFVNGNSILSAGGTGAAIRLGTERLGVVVANNLIEGFSGAGGRGIDGVSRAEGYFFFANNSIFDCETPFANNADAIVEEGNETLTESPFDKSGANTFANRKIFYSPRNVGLVHGGAFF